MKKAFKILISRKFPNDCIGSIEFYTELEQTASWEEEESLSEKVYNDTINDLKTCAEKDDLVKFIYEGIKKGASMVKTMQLPPGCTEKVILKNHE